ADSAKWHDTRLSGSMLIEPNNRIGIHTNSSTVHFNGMDWQTTQAQIEFSPGKTTIRDLAFRNGNQQIRLDGVVSRDSADQLRLVFDAFDLSTIRPFLPQLAFPISGTIDGRAEVNAILGRS